MAWDPRALIHGEDFYKNPQKYTTPSSQSPNISSGDAPKKTGGTVDFNKIAMDTYGTMNPLSGGQGSKPTAPQQSPQQPLNQSQSPQQTNANNWPYYEQLLLGLLNQPSAYTPPSKDDMLAQAKQYAGLQVDPVLSSITDMIQKAITSSSKGKAEIEAAYSGIPAKTQAMLGEARNYALENAISRGMGRSGVVNWETEKRTTPIIQWSQEKEGEKAAKLSGLAEELASAEASANRMRTDTESRRGTLEATKLSELEQMSRAMEQQAQAQKYQQAMGIANMALQDKSIDQRMLTQLLSQFMYG